MCAQGGMRKQSNQTIRTMKMQIQNRFVNMGHVDRFVRMMLGISLILVDQMFGLTWSFWAGMALLITATVRVCPIYALFKISTLSLSGHKTVIPWEEFLDLLPPQIEPEAVVAPASVQALPTAAPAVAPMSFSLPPELTQALIQDVERNALDEVLVIRFYENFFACKITVEQSGHLNSYACRFPDKTIRLDFAKLKAQLLNKLKETAT